MNLLPQGHRRKSRWSGPLRTVAAASLGAFTLGTVLCGTATADTNYWMPADEQLRLHGHGYGHGRGMSQYGALGAAQQGLTWRQIIDFYYPKTSLNTEASGRMRVLITEDTTTGLKISPATNLRLRDLADNRDNQKTWRLTKPTPGTDRWELRVNAHNQIFVMYHDNGGWHHWKVPGRGHLIGEGQFLAAEPITLWIPGSGGEVGQRYRGWLRTTNPDQTSRSRDTVNVVSLKSYVQGVVPSEMPATWDPDAVRAQAVAARTYAVRQRSQHAQRYYHVDDTTSYQVYGGKDAEHPASNAAVGDTSHTVVTYGGQPALTEFSSSSGGWTSASSLPYQVAKRDTYDAVDANPNHSWAQTVGAHRLEQSYPAIGDLQRIRVTDRNGAGQWGGRIERAVLVGSRGNQTVYGSTLRSAYGLRSDWFSIEATPIIRFWRRHGGPSSAVGSPTQAEHAVSGGAGQPFDHGAVYFRRGLGAHEVHGPIKNRFFQQGGAGGHLGLPTTNVNPTSDDTADKSRFQRGIIYHAPDVGAHEIHGPIMEAYGDEGWAAGHLGLPTTNVNPTSDDTADKSRFQRGIIYHAPDVGAHEIHGPIMRRYARMGWTTSRLGLPTSNVTATSDGNGSRSRFQRGVIYHTRGVGAFEIHGPIMRRYARMGWTTSRLGLPTSNVHPVTGGLRSDFQHGWIRWDRSTGKTTVHEG